MGADSWWIDARRIKAGGHGSGPDGKCMMADGKREVKREQAIGAGICHAIWPRTSVIHPSTTSTVICHLPSADSRPPFDTSPGRASNRRRPIHPVRLED